jgi:multicomponent K+:H+ antiporter subunit D
VFSEAGYAAAVYYTAHSTLAGAALFLVVDLVVRHRAAARDRLDVAGAMPRAALLGTLFFLVAVAIAGLPPLSGFAGKIMVLKAVRATGSAAVAWSVLLASTLLVVVALSRAGSAIFWRTDGSDGGSAPRLPRRGVAAAGALLVAVVGLVAWGGAVTAFAHATGRQLAQPSAYTDAVLGPGAPDRAMHRSLR